MFLRLLTSLNKEKIILIFIIFLAISFRFWNLGNVPPSASLDEASIGYNAYSVLKTGTDEYGSFPLISQRGYDDYRRSTYLFLVVPSVGLFGLNAFAVRLPSVILSVLTVLSSYYIVGLLFKVKSKFSTITSLLVPFLLAISPWHIYISRLGHESNACLSFLVFGMLFFLMGEKKRKFTLIILSLIFFTLSMISYYSGQVLIPVLLIYLSLIYRKSFLSIIFLNIKRIIIFAIFLIALIPIFLNIFSPTSLIRFQGTSTFKPEAHQDLYNMMVVNHNKAVKSKDIVGIILNNRRLYPVEVLIQGYISHFDPKWLFTNSSNEPFKIPNMGLLYPWELPFILLGVMVIVVNKELDVKSKLFIFIWFFLGPLPASVATQAPHAMRSYNFLPTWQIFTAFGVVYLYNKLEKFKAFTILLFLFLVVISVSNLYRNYFIIFPKTQSEPYQYSMKNIITYVNKNKSKYEKIVISNEKNLYQSYMFYLFYSKYNPKQYHFQGGSISGGFAVTHKIGALNFRPINWDKDRNLSGDMLVGNPSDFPPGAQVVYQSNYLDGKVGVEIVIP